MKTSSRWRNLNHRCPQKTSLKTASPASALRKYSQAMLSWKVSSHRFGVDSSTMTPPISSSMAAGVVFHGTGGASSEDNAAVSSATTSLENDELFDVAVLDQGESRFGVPRERLRVGLVVPGCVEDVVPAPRETDVVIREDHEATLSGHAPDVL